MRVRRAVAALAALLVTLPLAACGGDDPAPDAAPPADEDRWDLLVLSDSSGWGVADRWAALIERDLGKEVEATDLAVGGYLGTRMLEDLRTEGSEQRERASEAEVIMVWVSPLGLESADSSCYSERTLPTLPKPPTRADFAPYRQLVGDILAEIRDLRGAQPTFLVARDIYNAAAADHRTAGKAEECAAVMAMVSRTIRSAAADADAAFVSVYAAFNGPSRMLDPISRKLVSGDGEHMTGKGQRLQAEVLHRAGYAPLE